MGVDHQTCSISKDPMSGSSPSPTAENPCMDNNLINEENLMYEYHYYELMLKIMYYDNENNN